jgi:hypothetical protein
MRRPCDSTQLSSLTLGGGLAAGYRYRLLANPDVTIDADLIAGLHLSNSRRAIGGIRSGIGYVF